MNCQILSKNKDSENHKYDSWRFLKHYPLDRRVPQIPQQGLLSTHCEHEQRDNSEGGGKHDSQKTITPLFQLQGRRGETAKLQLKACPETPDRVTDRLEPPLLPFPLTTTSSSLMI